MPRSPLLNLRVDSARRERWQAAADRLGVPLAQFLKVAADEKIERETPIETPERRAPRVHAPPVEGDKRSYAQDPKGGR